MLECVQKNELALKEACGTQHIDCEKESLTVCSGANSPQEFNQCVRSHGVEINDKCEGKACDKHTSKFTRSGCDSDSILDARCDVHWGADGLFELTAWQGAAAAH